MKKNGLIIDEVDVHSYKVPTNGPESDGTLKWDSTTIVIVNLKAGGKTGLGYSYADTSAAFFIDHNFREILTQNNPLNIENIFNELHIGIRNNGNCGLAFMALSAVDIALWDLKSKLLDLPFSVLLGRVTEDISLYGSGGFTSYTDEQLAKQLEGWSEAGFTQVKIKIGREPEKDLQRIRVARDAINPKTVLFVDANGAYSAKQALGIAKEFEKYNVQWFEEPVSSDDIYGLSFVKNNSPAAVNIAAGEYGFDLPYFRNLLENHAVDVLQADATRCGGITGFLKAGRLAEAFQVPFSFHCAPSAHIYAAAALPGFYHRRIFLRSCSD